MFAIRINLNQRRTLTAQSLVLADLFPFQYFYLDIYHIVPYHNLQLRLYAFFFFLNRETHGFKHKLRGIIISRFGWTSLVSCIHFPISGTCITSSPG